MNCMISSTLTQNVPTKSLKRFYALDVLRTSMRKVSASAVAFSYMLHCSLFLCRRLPRFDIAGVPRKLIVRALEQAAGRRKKVSFTDEYDDTIDVAPEPSLQLEDVDCDPDPALEPEIDNLDDVPPLEPDDIDPDDAPMPEPIEQPPDAAPGLNSLTACDNPPLGLIS